MCGHFIITYELFFACIIREKLEAFLVESIESGYVTDGALAQDINQASSFWRIREVLGFHTGHYSIILF